MDKKELRKLIRNLKAQHSEEDLMLASHRICDAVMSLPRMNDADSILLYWSLPDEVCTHGLVKRLYSEGRTVLLPRVKTDTELSLHLYAGDGSMRQGAFGIMEPTTPELSDSELSSIVTPHTVAIIPGVAFDRQGHRLGRGRGYYDRMLKRPPLTAAYKTGICFHFQLLPLLPTTPYDVIMDEVVHS
ncbi:MAG: 5-formyltetrahydrofolate cyclo-ligase [Prevotella sp.]|nr:5-formyltetrahydrofolate cyclo-ligase [Prevotella sp.]